jgi:Acyl-protein synthetase, LuxE
MTSSLSQFAARLRETIQHSSHEFGADFGPLALELFGLTFAHNAAYRRFCESRGMTPGVLEDWTQIPAVPTAAFKEIDFSSLAPDERTAVFHSSGTTAQRPSRHFHDAESLAVYEDSLWAWFLANFNSASNAGSGHCLWAALTPSPGQAPHSSLVHMFETIRRRVGAPGRFFFGTMAEDGSWLLDFDGIMETLRSSCDEGKPITLLGTAFSFVHLLDWLGERNLCFTLPSGSCVMETGGYKGRSRVLAKADLHKLITEFLGIPPSGIISEYGMSELSSQAYSRGGTFQFPAWARCQIISPETGREVAEGETGLIRVFDLANIASVLAVQTGDLAVRRGRGFDLIGRAAVAEPRGCSLMTP